MYVSTAAGVVEYERRTAYFAKNISPDIIIHQVVDVGVSGSYTVYPACCLLVCPLFKVFVIPLLP